MRYLSPCLPAGLIAVLGCAHLFSPLPRSAALFPAIREDPLLQLDGDQYFTSWNPDGSKFAFMSNAAGNWDVWIVNADGTMPRQLTEASSQDNAAAWSPDGRRLIFSSDRVNRVWPDLWLIDPDQPTAAQRLTPGHGKYFFPSWSADGKQIAFIFLPTGPPDFELRYLTLDDGGVHTVFTDHIVFSQLAWSPDGKKIAFASERTGNPDIWVMALDDTATLQHVTDHPAVDKDPTWSPDGRYLAFTSTRSGNEDLWVMEAPPRLASNGAAAPRPQQLTRHPAADEYPHWSPDGASIAFTTNRRGNRDPWILTLQP